MKIQIKLKTLTFFIFFYALTGAVLSQSFSVPGAITNKVEISDPSALQYENGYYMTFGSGGGINPWCYEVNKGIWSLGNKIFTGMDKPLWWDTQFPVNEGIFWAPDVPSKWIMYYSFEADDETASAIGRAMAIGTAPDLKWRDDGPVLIMPACREKTSLCPIAIDPSVFSDDKGNIYMSFGSGTSGIWIVELDPATGHLCAKAAEGWTENNPAFHRVAYRNPERDDYIEASYVFRHPGNGYYYLFVNWGFCCRGVRSTYNIRVGRSTSPIGPFLDKKGKDMVDEGGSLVIQSEDRYIGPGHAGIYQHPDGRFAFSFYYFDGQVMGLPRLAVRNLEWEDDWPVVLKTEFLLQKD